MTTNGNTPASPPQPDIQIRVPIKLWVIFGVIVFLFFIFSYGITLYTDWLWFQSVQFEQIFTTELTAKVGVFFAVAFIFIILFLVNVYIARWLVKRNILFFSDEILIAQRVITYAIWGIALVLAWFVGSAASANWLTILQYLNQTPFDVVDPIFTKDVSFYVFTFPLLKFIQAWSIILLFFSLAGAAGIYLLEQRNNLEEGRIVILPHVQLHLSVLGAIIFCVFAWGHWLDGFDLMYSERGVVFGASYTDINVLLPVYKVLSGIAIIVAVILVLNIFIRRNALPLTAIFIWLIAGFLLRSVLPGIVQRFVVEPNELSKETPYIEHNITFTNHAYNLHNITEREFSNFETLTATDLEINAATIDNIRLWDYRPLLTTFRQLQELRLYYNFIDVDLDRYTVDGEYRQLALAVRELERSQLQSITWINERLQFTHGYGVVVNPVNEVTSEGLPNLWIKDIPPQSSVSLVISRPEIYFGESTDYYVFVNTLENEFDYPGEGNTTIYTSYEGVGGVRLSSFLKRLAFALRLGDGNIILSSDITNDSRILLYRQIQERVQTIAPFLYYDNDPYIVIDDDGKLYWILDAYTASNLYPYSEQVSNQFEPRRFANELNYIRNSVKILIDPYHGTVKFYLFDESDPLGQTYSKIFPELFEPASEIPPVLQAHVRYPEGLFRIQRMLYLSYHMTDVQNFYNLEDLWAIPQETFSGNTQNVEPYYVIARLPGEEHDEFMLIQPFTPHSKDNLVAWMAARSDGEHYGELVVYNFPKKELIYGTLQIEARIDQDPEISSQFSLWDQGGSEVIRGNLLVLPMGNALLYVEPIYLQADSGKIPELRRVIVASEDQVIMSNTLSEGLIKLLGSLDPNAPAFAGLEGDNQPDTSSSTLPIDATLKQLAESASNHYDAAQLALQAGDWATYGKELEALKADLDRLIQNIE